MRTVGETALKVSSRRLAPLPKERVCWVSMWSLGRCRPAGRGGIIGRAVAMVGGGAGDGTKAAGIECDIVDSIMRAADGPRDGGEQRGRAVFWGPRVRRGCLVSCAAEAADNTRRVGRAVGRAVRRVWRLVYNTIHYTQHTQYGV